MSHGTFLVLKKHVLGADADLAQRRAKTPPGRRNIIDRRTGPGYNCRMATLVIVEGPSSPEQPFPLGKEPAIIGRDPAAEVVLPSQAVSRRHVRISCQAGRYFIEDLGSRNGTYLNDQRVSGRTPLTEEDQLR